MDCLLLVLSINCTATLCSLYRKKTILIRDTQFFHVLGEHSSTDPVQTWTCPLILLTLNLHQFIYLLTFKCEKFIFLEIKQQKVYISWITNFFLDLLLIQMIFSVSLRHAAPTLYLPSFFFFFLWLLLVPPNKAAVIYWAFICVRYN